MFPYKGEKEMKEIILSLVILLLLIMEVKNDRDVNKKD